MPTRPAMLQAHPNVRSTETPNPLLHATVCPECRAPVQQSGRCLACPVCGWGKCG